MQKLQYPDRANHCWCCSAKWPEAVFTCTMTLWAGV